MLEVRAFDPGAFLTFLQKELKNSKTLRSRSCSMRDSKHQWQSRLLKKASSKAAGILTSGAYNNVSTAKLRERRWRTFSTDC